MDKIIISPSGHPISIPVTQEYRIMALEHKIMELEKKLHELQYQMCVHITTEG